MRLLIQGATVISMDPDVGDLRKASILIEDDRIAAIGKQVSAADAQVIDAAGLIALPGLVDAHRHVWQSPFSLIAVDADLNRYFANVPGRLAPVFEPDDLYTANRIGALQALDAGVTTLFDWSHALHTPDHADSAISGLRDSGIRAVFGYGFPNTEPAWSLDSQRPVPDDIRRVRSEVLCSDDALVTLGMSVRGPEQSTLEVTRHDLAVGRELGLRMSTHVGNGAFGVPYRAIENLHASGLMGPDIQYVHCNSLTDESIQRMADSGGTAVVTPAIEMQMQFGYPATTRLLSKGVRPGLGADVVTSTDYGLFAQMSSAFQASRLQALECGTCDISTRDVLHFATIDGARSIGLGDSVGSLKPGKKADVVLLEPSPWAPPNDPVGFVVLGAGIGNVHTVIVDGVVRKSAGRLQDANPADARSELQRVCSLLLERAGFTSALERLS